MRRGDSPFVSGFDHERNQRRFKRLLCGQTHQLQCGRLIVSLHGNGKHGGVVRSMKISRFLIRIENDFQVADSRGDRHGDRDLEWLEQGKILDQHARQFPVRLTRLRVHNRDGQELAATTTEISPSVRASAARIAAATSS